MILNSLKRDLVYYCEQLEAYVRFVGPAANRIDAGVWRVRGAQRVEWVAPSSLTRDW